jgi:glycerate kinase
MAPASGLVLVKPEERNPLLTTSRGTGELILSALDRDVREIIVGIGGSLGSDLVPDSLTCFTTMFATISRPCSLSVALEEAENNLLRAARSIAATVQIGMQIRALG